MAWLFTTQQQQMKKLNDRCKSRDYYHLFLTSSQFYVDIICYVLAYATSWFDGDVAISLVSLCDLIESETEDVSNKSVQKKKMNFYGFHGQLEMNALEKPFNRSIVEISKDFLCTLPIHKSVFLCPIEILTGYVTCNGPMVELWCSVAD